MFVNSMQAPKKTEINSTYNHLAIDTSYIFNLFLTSIFNLNTQLFLKKCSWVGWKKYEENKQVHLFIWHLRVGAKLFSEKLFMSCEVVF
jgi:hypothetical protein